MASLHKIRSPFILPSAVLCVARKRIRHYRAADAQPRVGDLAYGRVEALGAHGSLENKYGRIHRIHEGTRAVFVFGNRYAPDAYEGRVPETWVDRIDLISRSGIIAEMHVKHEGFKTPTKVRLLGYLCDQEGRVINTRESPLLAPKTIEKKMPRARMILVCGTSMNAGKTAAAVACCWQLASLGLRVHAAKVTGTATLKDILRMNDAGAARVADFTHFGHPSTYLLETEDLLAIFNTLDVKLANKPNGYWVVELGDGVLQRETAALLASSDVKSRIFRLVFCAKDAFGALSGIRILEERFGLTPDALSGVCSGSPLALKEISSFVETPVFNSLKMRSKQLRRILGLQADGQRPTRQKASADTLPASASETDRGPGAPFLDPRPGRLPAPRA